MSRWNLCQNKFTQTTSLCPKDCSLRALFLKFRSFMFWGEVVSYKTMWVIWIQQQKSYNHWNHCRVSHGEMFLWVVVVWMKSKIGAPRPFLAQARVLEVWSLNLHRLQSENLHEWSHPFVLYILRTKICHIEIHKVQDRCAAFAGRVGMMETKCSILWR